MEYRENGEDKKKSSFCFNFGDENMKLIDILSEDDDFLLLSDSPQDFFSDNTKGFEGFKLSSVVENGHAVKPHRPSFLRRSLAWDSAFLNSAGVLDHDELSFINKGFRTTHQDIRKRRSESITNGCKSTIDWFEIGPFENTRSAVKKVDRSLKNKINFRNEEKTTTRNRSRVISSPKPPKATINTSSRSNSKNLPEKSCVKMENKSSGSRFSPVASSFLKRKTEPRKSELSSSFLTSKNHCLSESISNEQRSFGSKSGLFKTKTLGVPFVHNDPKKATDLESKVYSPLMLPQENQSSRTRSVSLSTKNFRPSGLRPPSPNIRFFDENTPPRRKMLKETLSEGTSLPDSNMSYGKKLKKPCSEMAKNVEKSKTIRTTSNVKRSRDKLGLNPSSEVEKNKREMMNKRCKESPKAKFDSRKNLSCSVDQLGNLSKHFEGIDLNQESVSKCRKNPIENELVDSSSTRTPLADRTSICNSRVPFSIEKMKGKLVQMESSFYTSFEANDDKGE